MFTWPFNVSHVQKKSIKVGQSGEQKGPDLWGIIELAEQNMLIFHEEVNNVIYNRNIIIYI